MSEYTSGSRYTFTGQQYIFNTLYYCMHLCSMSRDTLNPTFSQENACSWLSTAHQKEPFIIVLLRTLAGWALYAKHSKKTTARYTNKQTKHYFRPRSKYHEGQALRLR